MERKIFLLTGLLTYLLLFESCSNSNRDINITRKEDFDAFYNRFFSDSIFQKSRIIFPLKGIHNEYIEYELIPKELTDWKESEWVFLTNIFSGDDSIKVIDRDKYIRSINKSDSIVIERIIIEDSGFQKCSKFVRRNNLWYLVEFNRSNY